MILPTIIIALIIITVIHVFSMAAGCWLIGANITKISIFYGKSLVRTSIGNTAINIGWIPSGGSVKCDDEFHLIHPIKRIFAVCFGCLSLLIISMAVFGTSEGFNKFIRGFDQVVSGALSPSVKGVFYWSLLTEFVRNNSIVTCIALMSCKMAAVNMLPLPSFNGGEIVLTLFEMIRPLPAKTREVLNQVGFLISIILFICWLWALLIYI